MYQMQQKVVEVVEVDDFMVGVRMKLMMEDEVEVRIGKIMIGEEVGE